MRFSVWLGNDKPWEDILATAKHAEATGWEGLWIADHFMPNARDTSGPIHEGWTAIAGLAAAIPRVRIGPMVTGNTYRHPAVLAKMAATVDHISGGRVVLGLGAGWQENEHRAYGIEFSDVRGRLDRLEEACQVISALFSEASSTFEGEHYQLVDAPLEPKPVQHPPPLLVGGGGERRTMRIAAQYAHEWNVWGTPEIMAAKHQVLDRHCEQLDRDPTSIRRSAVALLFLNDDEAVLTKLRGMGIERPSIIGNLQEVQEIVGNYAEVGVDELVVPDFSFRSQSEKLETLDRFVEEVVPVVS